MNTPSPRVESRLSYAQLWARVPRYLLFLLSGLVVVLPTSIFFMTLVPLSLGLAILYVGVPLGIATLYAARWVGEFELGRIRLGSGIKIERPRWSQKAAGNSEDGGGANQFFRAAFGVLRNSHYWMYALHAAIVNIFLTIFTWTVALSWTTIGVAGPLSLVSNLILPENLSGNRMLLAFLFPELEPAAIDLITITASLLIGLVFLLTLPVVLRGLMSLHVNVAKLMLSKFDTDALAEEVEVLAASRSAAVSAENSGLRRLERDIHDGPQQRLIRLQMDLDATERMLDKDPEAARARIAEARSQAGDALDELRALSRGFAPPILQDRGLALALESLAERNTIPTRIVSDLAPGQRLSAETEMGAYFVVAELLTNTAKHSAAASVSIEISLAEGATDGERRLAITITDDGKGGATFVNGHGLSGLGERIHGLRGTMQLSSPIGGPTRVVVSLPLIE